MLDVHIAVKMALTTIMQGRRGSKKQHEVIRTSPHASVFCYCTYWGESIGTSTLENCLPVFTKAKYKHYDSAIILLELYPREMNAVST